MKVKRINNSTHPISDGTPDTQNEQRKRNTYNTSTFQNKNKNIALAYNNLHCQTYNLYKRNTISKPNISHSYWNVKSNY